MRSRWSRVIVVVVVLALCGVALVWRLSRVPPAWYAPPPATDPIVVELADRAEYRLVQEAQKIREPDQDVWTLRIRQEQINAWLAARLRQWIEHEGERWPQQLGTPQVSVTPDALSIALPLVGESTTRYIVARIKPVIAHGKLRLELHRVALGRISLPGEPLANLLKTVADAAPDALDLPQINTAIDWLRRRDAIDPVIDLADDRRVRILDLQLDDGWIDVTARTIEHGEE
jgi:hypothetical protein